MLIVAGTIEAFVSPRRWPESVRLAIGLVTAIALVLYFASSGMQRGRERDGGSSTA